VSDDLDIRSGGAVAVDTASLEDAATEAGAIATLLEDAAASLAGAQVLLDGAGLVWVAGPSLRADTVSYAETARTVERALREAAACYELVEARVERASAAAAGDAPALARLDARVAALVAAHPELDDAARRVDDDWRDGWSEEFVRQVDQATFLLGGFLGAAASRALVGAVALGIGRGGLGEIRADARLRGTTPAPPMRMTSRSADAPPATLADLAARIPASPDRVRVERYDLPDGTRRFAVYVAGTQAWSGDDPWDMPSNIMLYSGAASDSYAATDAALVAAGAEPGDVVYAVGHSQGGMIVDHLALEGGYDTRAVVTFGSPVEAEVGDGTLSVQVRHRDDPVVLLAGPGSATPIGAPGGFIAERTVDPEGWIGDVALGPHQLAAYAETARMVDASGDPRAAHLHDVLGELAGSRAEVVVWAPDLSGPGASGGG
jgi:hypothetical protein